MKSAARFLLLFIALLSPPACLNAAETLGKTPAYFYDLYGVPKRDRKVSTAQFTNPIYIYAEPIKGPFQIRSYEEGKLRIEVTYSLPALEAVHVRYAMSTALWTEDQLKAALAAYGTGWKVIRGGMFPYYEATSGATAFQMASTVSIFSPAMLEQLAQAKAAKEAERKAVPKF